jgi:CHAT domain-containing protein/Tfp pilus assembly protein PilF
MTGDASGYYNAVLYQAEDLLHAGRFTLVPALLSSALAAVATRQPTSSLDSARALRLTGQALSRLGRHSDAIQAQSTALQIRVRELGRRNSLVAQSYHDLGLAFHEEQDLLQAYEHYITSLDLRAAMGQTLSREMAATLNNIGNIHWARGEYAEALTVHTIALDIKQQILTPDDPDIATSLDNLGNVYTDAGDVDNGLHLHKRALAIRERILQNHLFVGFTLHNIGSNLLLLGKAHESIYYFRRALAIIRGATTEVNQYVSGTELALGRALLAVGDTLTGLALLKTTARDLRQIGDPEAILALITLSEIEKKLGMGDGVRHLREASGILVHSRQSARPYEVRLLNALSRDAQEDGALVSAVQFADSAISTNLLLPFGGALRSDPAHLVLNYSELIESLELRSQAELLLAQGDPSRRDAHLRSTLSAVRHVVRVTSAIRRGLLGRDTNRNISAAISRVLTIGMEVALVLYRETGERQYVDDAFEFSELRRGGMLIDKLDYSQALQLAGVPDSLRNRMEVLFSELAFLRARLDARGSLDDHADRNSLVASLSERILVARRAIENFEARLTLEYPRLRALAQRPRVIQIERLQEILAGRSATLVEYAFGLDSLYIFVISENLVTVRSTSIHDSLSFAVRTFSAAITTEDIVSFQESGTLLYSSLIEPIAASLETEDILIVPDGDIFSIPFEALFTVPHESSYKDWRSIPFLIENWSFSYAYSASLIDRGTSLGGEIVPKGLLAVAPVYRASATVAASPDTYLDFDPIPYTLAEVDGLASLSSQIAVSTIRGGEGLYLVLRDDEATEAGLRSLDLARFKYLHFASHAFFSAAEPMSSGVILYPDKSPEHDNVIRVSEIYGLGLNADLVVLSACDTGAGVFYPGEGLLGLSHAFLYAGAKNVMASLWIGEDAATATIVLHFYRHLFAGATLTSSLTRAKRLVLNDMPQFASPLYWAHLTLVVG